MVIESGSTTCTLDLHPRLTVIAGVGKLERDSLIGELLAALASARSGVHLELVEDTGRRLAVFRADGKRPRVVDVDRVDDVTAQFSDGTGRIDLLAVTGLDAAAARRKLRFGAPDLRAASQGAALIRALAAADQAALWAAAETLLETEQILQAEAEALGSGPEDAAMIERVEQRHHRFEALHRRHERLRRLALVVAGLCTAAGAVVALLVDSVPALGLLLAACLAMVVSIVSRTRSERARGSEAEALAEVGAQSYLGFHLQRVNGMLSSEQARRRLMSAAEQNREAAEAWNALAGAIPVGWAVEHHEEITAAARVRIDISAHASISTEAAGGADDTTDLARVLVARLAELRHLGRSNESFPLLLDDPFADLDRGAKPALLELLSHTSGSPQLVYLTEDEDVASWARLEALTGALAVVEPAVEPAAAERERHRLTRSA
ncbi:MAG: hypothetical protein H0W25_15530 [Acidimicrobiia bacterium]|nr:hypothetical protein [Acidimicrobiia bacterium]